MEQPIRLVIVDDHEMVRDGLKAMLSRHGDAVIVVGEGSDREVPPPESAADHV